MRHLFGSGGSATDGDVRTWDSALSSSCQNALPGSAADRVAVHASAQPAAKSERVLPSEGGPALPPACDANVELIAQACEGVPLFAHFAPEERAALFRLMYRLELAPGQVLVKQGEPGHNFYVVVAGTLHVTRAEEDPAHPLMQPTLHPGDTFGDLTLLYNAVRRQGDGRRSA